MKLNLSTHNLNRREAVCHSTLYRSYSFGNIFCMRNHIHCSMSYLEQGINEIHMKHTVLCLYLHSTLQGRNIQGDFGIPLHRLHNLFSQFSNSRIYKNKLYLYILNLSRELYHKAEGRNHKLVEKLYHLNKLYTLQANQSMKHITGNNLHQGKRQF